MLDKLTDSEIIKALNECLSFEMVETMTNLKLDDIVDLINRLQAENERLNNDLAISKKETRRYKEGYKMACTERNEFLEQIETAEIKAYKECIEKVKDTALVIKENVFQGCYVISKANLDNLLKELVGEDNAKEKE